ncbi:uncharacterized protein EV154DRAFT_523519 [Mucor mucedo]|uniref:uncharacterized protein n=1 Tax=Mucor mucedo TaxID=29922 RepID=UPI00221E51EA|nr:uncharacterized protein EV154DRAFT_523519 [Mucor mucedo]KAI7881199.1 hypothetical protein EV154DRAFT_523519 [Mucor mucedo]
MRSNHDKPFGQKFFLSSRRPSSSSSSNSLRGIHINISSDPFQHRIPPYIQRLWQESKLRRHLSVWKRRCIKRYAASGWLELVVLATGLFSACIILLVHVGFFSGKKYQDWQMEHYNDPMDEVDLLDKVYPDEGRSLTTSIILLQNEQALEETVKPILSELCQYDMFAHYIVWNDDPSLHITIDMIHTTGCNSNKLRVINAPAKMGSSARYHACRLSKTSYCYFQDIPRSDQKLRSIYANFLRWPHLIHGQSSHHAAFLDSQWRYCFVNTNLDIHTCYMDMASGTFVTKTAVSNFMDNFDKTSVVDEYADMYFTMFMNQIPYALEGGSSSDSSKKKKELDERELEHMDLGLTILYNDLEEEEGVAPLNSEVETTTTVVMDRHARASCGDDRCLFLTNKRILPNIELFSYNPTIDVNVSREMHSDFYAGYDDAFKYAGAVDGEDQTAWKSVENIHAGDYIGLDLLMPMRTSLKYRFLVRHPYIYTSTLSTKISYDGSIWIKLHPPPSINCQNMDERDVQLLECRFIVTDTGYRYIQLESQKDLDFAFHVHDLSLSAKVKKDDNGQLLDIAFDGVAFVEDGLI